MFAKWDICRLIGKIIATPSPIGRFTVMEKGRTGLSVVNGASVSFVGRSSFLGRTDAWMR
jgi:hypothetical protein